MIQTPGHLGLFSPNEFIEKIRHDKLAKLNGTPFKRIDFEDDEEENEIKHPKPPSIPSTPTLPSPPRSTVFYKTLYDEQILPRRIIDDKGTIEPELDDIESPSQLTATLMGTSPPFTPFLHSKKREESPEESISIDDDQSPLQYSLKLMTSPPNTPFIKVAVNETALEARKRYEDTLIPTDSSTDMSSPELSSPPKTISLMEPTPAHVRVVSRALNDSPLSPEIEFPETSTKILTMHELNMLLNPTNVLNPKIPAPQTTEADYSPAPATMLFSNQQLKAIATSKYTSPTPNVMSPIPDTPQLSSPPVSIALLKIDDSEKVKKPVMQQQKKDSHPIKQQQAVSTHAEITQVKPIETNKGLRLPNKYKHATNRMSTALQPKTPSPDHSSQVNPRVLMFTNTKENSVPVNKFVYNKKY